MNRRRFLTSASATGAGLLLLKSTTLFGQNTPSKKLNVALIGVWGRGLAHYEGLSKENVVALCDINETRFPAALEKFPGAKTYVDWRKCLEQEYSSRPQRFFSAYRSRGQRAILTRTHDGSSWRTPGPSPCLAQ